MVDLTCMVVCVCVCVCMCGFCNVWVYVCVVLVMCGCFDNMYTCYVEIKCQLDATDYFFLNHLLYLVGILFPHIKEDARSKSLQI